MLGKISTIVSLEFFAEKWASSFNEKNGFETFFY